MILTFGRPRRASEPEPTAILTEQAAPAYTSRSQWNVERPRVLVACCSDERLQEAIDEFLQNHLHIRDYDRFYAPGGPGALTPGGYEFLRATQYRDDLAFLIRVHKVEELRLIFHGPHRTARRRRPLPITAASCRGRVRRRSGSSSFRTSLTCGCT